MDILARELIQGREYSKNEALYRVVWMDKFMIEYSGYMLHSAIYSSSSLNLIRNLRSSASHAIPNEIHSPAQRISRRRSHETS